MPKVPRRQRLAAWSLIAWFAATMGACGGTAQTDLIVLPPSAYAFCKDLGKSSPGDTTREAECQAHAEGVDAGFVVGTAEGESHVRDQTRGGYRLRSAFSLGLGSLAGLVVGTLLGAWVVSRLKRRRAIPHAQHLLGKLVGEATAVRRLGEPGQASEDPVVTAAVQRLGLVVGEVERRGAVIAEKCKRLEEKAADAVEQAHLQGLYGRLDELLLLLGRIRIRVNLWVERRVAPDSAAAEREVAQVLAEMGQAEDEAPMLTSAVGGDDEANETNETNETNESNETNDSGDDEAAAAAADHRAPKTDLSPPKTPTDAAPGDTPS